MISALAIPAAIAVVVSCSAAAESPTAMSYGGSANAGSAGSIGVGAFAGNGSGGLSPDAGCAYASVKGELLPTNILFVVHRSGSMNCNLPPPTTSAACELDPARSDAAQPSKWQIVSRALKDAFAQLPARAGVGLSFFNNNNEWLGWAGPRAGPIAITPGRLPRQATATST